MVHQYKQSAEDSSAQVPPQLRARTMAVIHSLFTMMHATLGAVDPGAKKHFMSFLEPCLQGAICAQQKQ